MRVYQPSNLISPWLPCSDHHKVPAVMYLLCEELQNKLQMALTGTGNLDTLLDLLGNFQRLSTTLTRTMWILSIVSLPVVIFYLIFSLSSLSGYSKRCCELLRQDSGSNSPIAQTCSLSVCKKVQEYQEKDLFVLYSNLSHHT